MLKLPVYDKIKLNDGLAVTFMTLRWDDGWDFDCPSMCLSPIIRCFEDGSSHDRIIGDICVDAVCSGFIKSRSFEGWTWRGYRLPVLRRRFREALGGKNFPVAKYEAKQEVIIFKAIISECGIEWDWSPLAPAGQVFRRKRRPQLIKN
jgi:hypothetical protein